MVTSSNEIESNLLFDELILLSDEAIKENIDLAKAQGFILRPLHVDDFSRGYLPLLTHLTTVGDVSKEKFNETFQVMKKHGTYYILTIIDPTVDKVIGTTTLFLEYKFIHSCALRARIEDVVVDETYRGKHLGKLLVKTAILLAKNLKCYKLSLDCSDEMKLFYLSLGFIAEDGRDNMLVIRLN